MRKSTIRLPSLIEFQLIPKVINGLQKIGSTCKTKGHLTAALPEQIRPYILLDEYFLLISISAIYMYYFKDIDTFEV
jgi:hypothetical protein